MLHTCCALCSQPAEAAVNLGRLLGPIRDTKNPAADELFVHRMCAIWSPEVEETEYGTLKGVLAAIKRGRQLKCSHCKRKGATLGCRVPSCSCTYHVACARDAGCTFYCNQFLLACREHAPGFRAEARQQTWRTPFTPYRHAAAAGARAEGAARLAQGAAAAGAAAADAGEEPGYTPGGADGEMAGLPSPVELPTFVARKRGRRRELMESHLVEARAAMKRARRELERRRKREAESSDDDEHFQKKEARRLERDTAKLNPITLKGDGTAVQHIYVKPSAPGMDGPPAPGKGAPPGQQPRDKAAAAAAEAVLGHHPLAHSGQPQQQQQQQQQATVETAVVGSIATTDFSSVAGLDDVVQQLREMVLLPMQYPALFEGMGLRPPRGILFHGVPGTGKTLVARALAGACAKHSPLPVTFFARKGADCLGKFHGEAERTLRLLFEEASRRAPAIIFLDELDALVPARAARAGGSDQIYASVVSTLLSLMDGVTDRGSVIVIGATNRPEAIDPALRRPGRFDREVYFGLPTPAQRLAILRVHTQRWAHPPSEEILKLVAAKAEGYAGADLQALCTAAVMAAVRRSAPLLLEQADREAAAAAAAVGSPQQAAIQGGPLLGQQQQQQQGMVFQPEGEQLLRQNLERERERRQKLLDGIEVLPSDWREALAAAPPPCSRRHGLSALATEAAAPLQQHNLPLVEEPLRQVLAALHSADLPLPPAAAAAAAAAAAKAQAGGVHAGAAAAAARAGAGPGSGQEQQQGQGVRQDQAAALEAVLLEQGALLPPPGTSGAASQAATVSAVAASAAHPIARTERRGGEEQEQQLQRLGRSYVPCRLLLWGEGEQGQEAAAGALLKLLDGCPVHCLSLPSLVVEGGADAASGCVALVGEALRRAGPHAPCVFYLPRVESWALSETRMKAEDLAESGCFSELPRGTSSNSSKERGPKGAAEHGGEQPGGSGCQPLSARHRVAQSPSFASAVTSPRVASPSQRGFPAAPSPFSGLLPLEDRAGHTPAVARALRSVTQLHRHQEGQQEQGLGLQGQGQQGQEEGHRSEQGEGQQDEGPTLWDLQRRASSAEPTTAGRPPRPPLAAQVLAPPPRLPPIRTSPDQPAQQQHQQQEKQGGLLMQPAALSASAAPVSTAQVAGPAPASGLLPQKPGVSARQGQQEGDSMGEEEEEEEVEVVSLSQAWSVFEALMRQVPATQPVIVLATCHTPADATPANLVQFFAGPAALHDAGPVAGPGMHPQSQREQQQQQRQQAPALQGPLGEPLPSVAAPADAAAVAAPGIVRMAQTSDAAWRRAAAATAERVAAAVGTQAALLLHRRLLQAGGEEGSGEARTGPGSVAAAESKGPQQAGTSEQQGQEGPLSPALTPNRRRALGRRRGAQQQQQQAGEQQGAQPEQCNTVELEQGLRLFDRLLSFQQQMATALARERLPTLHCWAGRPSSAGGGSGRRPGSAGAPSFAVIAERCRLGAYDSVDALQADAAGAAAQVLALADEAQQQQERAGRGRGRQQEPQSPDARYEAQAAVTAACSLHDKIDTACFALRQELQLGEPSNARLLAAAAAHVRSLQRKQQQEAERQQQQQHREEEQRQQQEATLQAQGRGVQEEEEGGREAAQQQQLQGEQLRQEEQQEQEEEQQQAEPATQAPSPEPACASEQPALQQQGAVAASPAGAGQQLQEAPEAGPSDERQEQGQGQQEQGQGQQHHQVQEEHGQEQQEHEQQPGQDQVAQGQQQQRASQASQQLRQRLAQLLLPAVQRRLPAAPPAGFGSAWQALQDSAGRLSAAAMAACGRVIGADPSASAATARPSVGAAAAAGGAAAISAATLGSLDVGGLAERCAAAFEEEAAQKGAAAGGC